MTSPECELLSNWSFREVKVHSVSLNTCLVYRLGCSTLSAASLDRNDLFWTINNSIVVVYFNLQNKWKIHYLAKTMWTPETLHLYCM